MLHLLYLNYLQNAIKLVKIQSNNFFILNILNLNQMVVINLNEGILMNSAPIYYEDTYRFSGQAVVESFGVDDKGHYIILDRTLFYPQGGGQPADQGCLIIDEQQILICAVRLC